MTEIESTGNKKTPIPPVEIPKGWKPDVRASAYQVLCDQLYIELENMNDDVDLEKALENGPGDRELVLAALQRRFHVDLHEIEASMTGSEITTVGHLIDDIHERF